MDADPEAGTPGGQSWSPPWWRIGAYLTVALACAAVAAFEGLAARVGSLDAPGRLLFAIVGAGVLGMAARDALARPALRVDADGLVVVDGVRRRLLPWAAVLRVDAATVSHSRRAVHVRILEISTVDGPVLLSRRQLGTDPEKVAAVVERYRLHHG